MSSQGNQGGGCASLLVGFFFILVAWSFSLIEALEKINQQPRQAPRKQSPTIILPQPQSPNLIPNLFSTQQFQTPGFAQKWMQPQKQVKCWTEYNMLAGGYETICEER